MKTIQKHLLLFSLFCSVAFYQPLSAQEDTAAIWQIQTIDGNEYIGTIIERTDQAIQLQTENLGTLTIQTSDIKRMRQVKVNQVVGGEVWTDNPQATRYFWSPNGYGLQRGEGYYQNIGILFNQVSVGITDNTSIGAGILPLFLFAGTETPVWITPKVSFPVMRNQFNIGAGALLGGVIGAENSLFGIAYGTFTLGNRDKNFSAGLGYGFADGGWANAPAINLSGMIRLGKKGYFLTENYFLPAEGDNAIALSAGFRTVWNSLSLDYGLILPIIEDSSFIIIPWLSLTVPFGSNP